MIEQKLSDESNSFTEEDISENSASRVTRGTPNLKEPLPIIPMKNNFHVDLPQKKLSGNFHVSFGKTPANDDFK